MSRLRFTLAACVLMAAGTPAVAAIPASADSTNPVSRSAGGETCTLPKGWSAVAARKTRFVVFGEMHGTRQSPEFVGNLACALASRGERLLVGVELGSYLDPALQSAWQLPDSQFPAALRESGWKGRTDGVASEAMFALLLGLHRLKEQGRAIDVVAFNGTAAQAQDPRFRELPGQGPHEAAQADNIRRAAARADYDHVLVLVGNLHARKRPVSDGDIRFEPMAMRLAPASEVTSLGMASGAGTMWNCLRKASVEIAPGAQIPAGAFECGLHPSGGKDLHREPFIGLGPSPAPVWDDDPYDGFYWVGPISGSPPAVR